MLQARNMIQFERYLNWQLQQKSNFKIIVENSKRSIQMKEKKGHGISFKNKLTDDEMKLLWVFAAIKKSAKKRVNEMEEGFKHYNLPSKKWNRKLYAAIESGTPFVGIDINHAYLRTAYLRKYISERLYNKLMDAKYKGVRNKALACLNSTRKVYEYENGEVVSSYEEGDPLLAAAYLEIRTCTYKVMDDIANLIGPDFFLKYHTDCIYFLKEKEDIVTAELDARMYKWKINPCIKMNEIIFADGDEVKDF